MKRDGSQESRALGAVFGVGLQTKLLALCWEEIVLQAGWATASFVMSSLWTLWPQKQRVTLEQGWAASPSMCSWGVRKRALPSAEGEADAPGELFWALPQPYHPLATQAAKATVPLCSLALAMCVCCSVVQGGWEKLGPVSVPCHNPCSDSSSRSWAG